MFPVRGSERFGRVRTQLRTVRERLDREPYVGPVHLICGTVDRTVEEPDRWSGSNHGSGPDRGSTIFIVDVPLKFGIILCRRVD
jgi:hypothetical protein